MKQPTGNLTQTAPRIANLLIVWLIISIFHFGLYSTMTVRKLAAHTSLEFERVGNLVAPGENPYAMTPEALYNTRTKENIYQRLEFGLSLPLLPFLFPAQPTTAHYQALSIPVWWRFLNSAAASLFIYAFLYLVSRLLPAGSSLRIFLEGRRIWQKGGIPRVFDFIPLFRTARSFEKLEKKRLGPVFIVAVFHFMLTGASNFILIAYRLRVDSQSVPLVSRIMRLPLTPLLVDDRFWTARHSVPAVKFIVSAGNSVLAAIILLVVLRILRSGTLSR